MIEVKVPRLPESVSDATLVNWHKAPGDIVERDENLADLETDKVVLEVPAPQRGILREIRVQAGSTVTSGQLLAVFEATAGDRPVAVVADGQPAPVTAVAADATSATAPPAERNSGKTGPAVRRLAAEQGIDPTMLQGSGPQGRIQKSDVRKPVATGCPQVARAGDRRWSHRAASADDTPAREDCRAPGNGPAHGGHADHFQRG